MRKGEIKNPGARCLRIAFVSDLSSSFDMLTNETITKLNGKTEIRLFE